MARLTNLLAAATFATTAAAHFRLVWPESGIGSDTSDQDSGPCGGHTPSESDDTQDFYVGGDAVAMMDAHSSSDWLIRATLEKDASGGWEQLYPIYQTRGAGRSCQPSVTAPEDWVGERGIIGIVGSATDGILYHCAAVTFVEGTAPDRDGCNNGTNIRFDFVENSDLDDQLGNSTSSPTSSPSPSGSNGSESDDNDNGDGNAASSMNGGVVTGLVFSVAAAVGAAVLMV